SKTIRCECFPVTGEQVVLACLTPPTVEANSIFWFWSRFSRASNRALYQSLLISVRQRIEFSAARLSSCEMNSHRLVASRAHSHGCQRLQVMRLLLLPGGTLQMRFS